MKTIIYEIEDGLLLYSYIDNYFIKEILREKLIFSIRKIRDEFSRCSIYYVKCLELKDETCRFEL